ncbi:MAG: ISKra4 family transposase [Methylococcales bacterium]|nr:ISKra4 family transposase [Methylococcales bacterium]
MAEVIAHDGDELTIQVKVKITGSLLEAEHIILDACNEVGQLATSHAIKKFDTEGSPIQIAGTKLTAKAATPKQYETPYGCVEVSRYVYQSSQGGCTYCPLEQDARIIGSATPRFAQHVSHKYANLNAPAICLDLEANHHRKIAHSYVQAVADLVGTIASAKEALWSYTTPLLDEAITSVVVSMDGAYVLMREDGYREARVGAISLYDAKGDRQHSIYIGEAPEYGKATFTERLEREIAQVKKQYPAALYLGIADGAKNNWPFLEKHTGRQLPDFFHATEYLADVAHTAFPGKTDKPKREAWLHERCRQLKHDVGAVDAIIAEMEKLANRKKLTKGTQENLAAAQTYFANNRQRMNYAEHVQHNLPIGSGVTEAACKTLVKQRLCCSGIRWKPQGAKVILSLWALIQLKDRWQQFWDKIDQFGAQVCS